MTEIIRVNFGAQWPNPILIRHSRDATKAIAGPREAMRFLQQLGPCGRPSYWRAMTACKYALQHKCDTALARAFFVDACTEYEIFKNFEM